MNLYMHHLGDYLKDTAHLSMVEDGAYRRLLDLYYQHEQPLPADKRQVYRLARASAAAERKAIDTILNEYFDLGEQGYAHHRCEAEIAKYREKSDKARNSAARRWQGGTQSKGNANAHANASTDAMRTHSDGNANQEPITNNHKNQGAAATPPTYAHEGQTDAAPPGEPDDGRTANAIHARAIELTALLRKRGASLQASDPRVRAWAADGITDAQALAALERAQERRHASASPQSIAAGYLDPIIRDVAAKGPAQKPQAAPVDRWWITDAGIDRKARELGMFARGGETYAAFKDRIFAELRKRGEPTEEQAA